MPIQRGDQPAAQHVHQTGASVGLGCPIVMLCSRRGGIVLDGFAGSGSTLIAAERTGWRGFGIELDPKYVDVAIERYERLTGHSVVHAASGATFAEIRPSRRSTDTSRQNATDS